jgi:hypothetical protein
MHLKVLGNCPEMLQDNGALWNALNIWETLWAMLKRK